MRFGFGLAALAAATCLSAPAQAALVIDGAGTFKYQTFNYDTGTLSPVQTVYAALTITIPDGLIGDVGQDFALGSKGGVISFGYDFLYQNGTAMVSFDPYVDLLDPAPWSNVSGSASIAIGKNDAFWFEGAFHGQLFRNTDPATAGVVQFAILQAVPEPATWALMVAGFGIAGGGMRRRAHQKPLTA